MRVLFCSQAAHTGGGVETWMESLTSALESRGVEVFTALAKGRFHDPVRYAARHRVARPIEVDGAAGYREVRIANLLDVFERVQPDVIVPVHLEDALLAGAYGKAHGAPWHLAVCIHSQGQDRVDQVRRVAPFVDLAVGVSMRVTMQLQTIVAKAQHIPTGVPPPLATPRVRERIAKIGYIGRLDQSEKRVLDLIPFAHALGDVELHVAGAGVEGARLRQELPSAIFHGAMSRDELYSSLYPTLEAIVLFSEAEGGPIVAWEAMAHGVIPIVSDYLGRAEENVIRDGGTGIVFDVGDTALAAEKVRTATNVAELSRRASSELPAAYTMTAFEDAWIDVLRTCASAPIRRAEPDALPPLVSPGRLAGLGLPLKTMARIRRVTRSTFVHHDAGSEWPH